jgi:hypothetical protein
MRTMVLGIAAAFLLMPALLACNDQGPMEKAGEKMDKAVDDITHPGEGALEKAGRKTDEAVDSLQEKLEE